MDKKFKVFLIVALLLCFLVFLYLRREKSKENFECVKIDKSLFCPVEKSDIDTFRRDQDPNYKSSLEDRSFYRFLSDFETTSGDKLIFQGKVYNYETPDENKIMEFNNYKEPKHKFETSLKFNDFKLYHKYDFIKCENTEFSPESLKDGKDTDAKKIMSPGGVLFDKFNDDIIIFDIYNLKRFSYRDLRIKHRDGVSDYYPLLDSMAIPIDDINQIYRIELLDILFIFNNLPVVQELDFTDINYQNFLTKTDAVIFKDVDEMLYNLNLSEYKDKNFTMKYKSTDLEKEITTKDLVKRIKFLVDNLKKTQKFKTCIEDFKKKDGEKVCRIKYQRDLPEFDMGDLEGKGIESMQYDDKPETVIHSTYLDNRMSPWANSWNNIKSEGIFSPLILDRTRRMKIFNTQGGLKYNDGIDTEAAEKKNRGKVVGIKQNSEALDPKKKANVYNDTMIKPEEGAPEKYFDDKLKDNNIVHEKFSNIDDREKAFKQITRNENKDRKIHYGYPSINLKGNFSVGVYNIPDEMDSTGIGMEIVDTGSEQIILVPDLYNNRIQIFKKDKSELVFYGQFGNLPYTSQRSLPMYDAHHTRYEPIHDTENYNSEPGCRKICDFDADSNYIGPKNTDMMGNKCVEWSQFSDEELKIDGQQINAQLKEEGFNKEEFLKKIREDLKEGKKLGDNCITLMDPGGQKEPACVVNKNGKNILRKCFPDFDDGSKVVNKDSCDNYLKEYTERYGPIDANNCLGDNDERTLTQEEIKKGVLGKKDCVFECDPRFSYRRANIHQRQIGYKFDNFTKEELQLYRKRGHFYSLFEEFNRCKKGIDKEKETGKPVFLDAEFINPHFLGVDSQACVGKKTKEGLCASLDTRMTSGVDNCSLGYRKYLLKMINITNQGQKFGQLFHPKSIAYDDVDKKYYVVDCYHHCVQCFEMKPEKKNTESGEKLDFICADEPINDKHIFYYDENFNTPEALKYNRSEIYALGLRQNLLYEEDLNTFSRIGEVNDEVSPHSKRVFAAREFISSLDGEFQKVKDTLKKIDELNLKKIEGASIRGNNSKNKKDDKKEDDDNKNNDDNKNTDDNKNNTKEGFENMEKLASFYDKQIIKLISETKKTLSFLSSKLGEVPRGTLTEHELKIINDKIEQLILELDTEVPEEEKEKMEAASQENIRKERVNQSKEVELNIPKPGLVESSIPNDKRRYPDGSHSTPWQDSTKNATNGFHSKHPYNNSGAVIIGPVGGEDGVFFTGIRTWGASTLKGRYKNYYVKKFKISIGTSEETLTLIKGPLADGTFMGNANAWQQKTIKLPKKIFGKYIKIDGALGRNDGAVIFRCEVDYQRVEKKKIRMYQGKEIDNDGYFIDAEGNRLLEKTDEEKKEENKQNLSEKKSLNKSLLIFNGNSMKAGANTFLLDDYLIDEYGNYVDPSGIRIKGLKFKATNKIKEDLTNKKGIVDLGSSIGPNTSKLITPAADESKGEYYDYEGLKQRIDGGELINSWYFGRVGRALGGENTRRRGINDFNKKVKKISSDGKNLKIELSSTWKSDRYRGYNYFSIQFTVPMKIRDVYEIKKENLKESEKNILDSKKIEQTEQTEGKDYGLLEETEEETGFSMISPNWANKYSDTTIRLNRWVSGISEWGNHIYKGFKEKIDYKKISENKDFYFNTEKGGNGGSPGCGEFSYPSDIAITKTSCLGQGVQMMMVTDTGNNRISIFKKYNLDGNMRFRFYSFLGDEEEKVENKTFVNPISICMSEVSGCVFVLEANFYDNVINKNQPTNTDQTQRIKVYYPDMKKKNYFYSHTIEINKFVNQNTYDKLTEIYKGENQIDTVPRITKIRIDDRGILALTDIHNNKVHLLKESISADFQIKKIDDSALNKVSIDIDYDPYKSFRSYNDREEYPIINSDRVRFIFQRQRVCAFQNGDVILSKEFKTGNIPFGDYKKSFHIEDIRQELEYDNCWVMNTETGIKYLPIDKIDTEESGDGTVKNVRKELNRPNFDINKKYLKDGTLVNYEDWTGRSLEPNSSYLYKIFAYNYNFIKDTETNTNKVVQTYPLYLSDDDITPRNIVNDKENYISLNINYDYDSKKYNPICFTILRRIHNRTKDIVSKNINCVKGSKIQLFLPKQSKIIFQIKSRPKLGRLYYYDIEKGGEFEKNLVEMERGFEYAENKYLIFYSCEGGDEKVGGYSIPDSETIGRDTLNDTFTLGDRLETVHNQVTYNVLIDITKTDTKPIMFKDNELVDENIRYYKKSFIEKNSSDLEKLVKLSYAKKVADEKYYYPGIIEYCDKGINLGPDNIRPIEMNQTYEYVILVSNPFKVNPAVNSFYYTTKPEKPYIHSVEFDALALENNESLFRGSELKNDNPNNNKITIDGGEDPNELSIAKVTWYYPKNRSLYWPLNFIVLRKDVSNKPIAIQPNTYDIDFNFVARPSENDKLFRIKKKSLKLKNNSDADSSGVLKRRYNLQKQMDWRIKIFGTPGVEIMLNREKYNWSEPYIELKQTKYLDLTIKLKGQQQITNITCEETVIVDEEEDLDAVSSSPSVTADPERLKQLEQYKKEQEKIANQKLKAAVEEHRKSSNINFIFNLGDDYHGYYTNVANAPKTGYNGSLYRYIKDMTMEKLLDIFDELHNEMKIYHGDVGLRMDGSNGMLRSGDKEMIIDKIRHFAFILREHKKSEQKAMGVDCTPLELNDIKIVSTKDGDEPKVQAIICQNTDVPVPAFSPIPTSITDTEPDLISPAPSIPRPPLRCPELPDTGLKGDDKQVITNVTTLGECCYKCQMSTECAVAEYKESEKMCEIHKNYSPDNEIPNKPGSRLLGKEEDTFNLPPVVSDAPAEGEEVIPPHLSDWEVVKTVYRKKEIIADYTFRYPKDIQEEDRKKIQKEFAFEPTIVSLSSDPEGLEGGPPVGSESHIEFSSHEVSIPIPKGRKYAYKIAVFQTGFNLDSEEKRKFMGVETKNTTLGLGEVYSNEIELGESITETIIINKPPFMPIPTFKEPKVDRPVIKFFEPKQGDANSIVRIVGLKLDELEYISFRDVKVKVLKKQERIIGNVKYQEYLVKPPSVKELDRKCWQSIEKYRALVWGYWHGYQIINSENGEKNKMFSYTSLGDCEFEDKKK